MPATTYSISVNEETARQFEAAAASQGLEPSEVLCRLVREYVKEGGFAKEAESPADEADSLEQQASEWLAMRAAGERRHPEDAQAFAGFTPSAEWGLHASGALDGSREEGNGRPPLPWEDPDQPTLPWQAESPNPRPKLPWED